VCKTTYENRKEINDFICSHWLSTDMVVRGELVDMTILDSFVIYKEETIIGLVTYGIRCNECEIMSLDSLREREGNWCSKRIKYTTSSNKGIPASSLSLLGCGVVKPMKPSYSI
jgi:hypothetical protein